MKSAYHSLWLILSITISLYSCQTTETAPARWASLPTESWQIRLTQDTVLKSKSGVVIYLPQNAWESEETVALNLQTALTLGDMLKAGLSTVDTEGEWLRTAGMFRLTAEANGNPIPLQNPITVTVPSRGLPDIDMKAFNGIETEAGIIWEATDQPVTSDSLREFIQQGRALFEQYCAACHAPFATRIGPALVGAADKYPEEWLIAFTQNAPDMIAKGDSMALCLYYQWDVQQMQSFPSLTATQVKSIYAYLEQVGTQKPSYIAPVSPCDSSNTRADFIDRIRQRRDSMATSQQNVPQILSPISYPNSGYYLTINDWGWTNLDRYYKRMDLNPITYDVVVMEEGKQTDWTSVHLILPAERVVVIGGQSAEGSWIFPGADANQHMYLPNEGKALIVALQGSDATPTHWAVAQADLPIEGKWGVVLEPVPLEQAELEEWLQMWE